VTPFFQPYDDAIEAQEANAEREFRTVEYEPPEEPQRGPDEHPEGQPAHSLA
jgi:hypothetical protein